MTTLYIFGGLFAITYWGLFALLCLQIQKLIRQEKAKQTFSNTDVRDLAVQLKSVVWTKCACKKDLYLEFNFCPYCSLKRVE